MDHTSGYVISGHKHCKTETKLKDFYLSRVCYKGVCFHIFTITQTSTLPGMNLAWSENMFLEAFANYFKLKSPSHKYSHPYFNTV